MLDNQNQIEGKNPVLEALRGDRDIEKILISKDLDDGRTRQIIAKARNKNILVQRVDKRHLDNIAVSASHQGVIAIAASYNYVDVDDILENASKGDAPPFILILDEITDPHNFGAIIRTAECSGVDGIIIPKHRSVGLTPTVVKASAGAVEHMMIAKVTNIANTIDYIKEKGLWVAGADMEGSVYTKENLDGPIALVIGSEGKGLGRLVKEKCDFLVKIPMKGKIQSLNASVAAAVLMYEIVRQRG